MPQSLKIEAHGVIRELQVNIQVVFSETVNNSV